MLNFTSSCRFAPAFPSFAPRSTSPPPDVRGKVNVKCEVGVYILIGANHKVRTAREDLTSVGQVPREPVSRAEALCHFVLNGRPFTWDKVESFRVTFEDYPRVLESCGGRARSVATSRRLLVMLVCGMLLLLSLRSSPVPALAPSLTFFHADLSAEVNHEVNMR